MNYLWLLLAVALPTGPARAQNPNALSPSKVAATTSSAPKVYTFVEEMPQPPGGGGNAAISALLVQELHFSPVRLTEQVSGSRVVVEFTVTKTGTVSTVRILKSFSRSIDDEVIRAVKALPLLTPGRQQGVPVNVKIMVPITICLRQ